MTDLLVLLAAWGFCGGGGGEPIPTTVNQCLERYDTAADEYACICGGCLSGQITEGCPPACLSQ